MHDRKRSNIERILILTCLVIFLFSMLQIIKVKINGYNEEKDFSNLRNQIHKSGIVKKSEERQGGSSSKLDQNKSNQNEEVLKSNNEQNKVIYNQVYEENSDYVGWISIPDTPIDYPVMSTPKNPNFYLHRNFSKEYSASGTPFIGDGVSVDSKSFIIYAHNMKNKTMFGTLEYYKDTEYKNIHKYIYFNTLGENRVYEVIGAFYEQIDIGNPRHFNYYNYTGDISENDYNELIRKISDISIYGEIKDIQKPEQLIMLSTCSYFAEEGRFVVIAKRIIK